LFEHFSHHQWLARSLCEQSLAMATSLVSDGNEPGIADVRLSELRARAHEARRGASEVEALLARREPELRRQAAEIAAELGNLGAEAGRQAAAADLCTAQLRKRAEALRTGLASTRADGGHLDSLMRRRAVLEAEVQVLERRAEEERGPCESAFRREAEQREALEARIAGAEDRRSKAAQTALAMVRQCEDRLAALREERYELEATAAPHMSWRARFEALVAAQNAIADRAAAAGADPGAAQLDHALAAAADAVRSAEGNGPTTPESLSNTARCLHRLAEAERRRRGLLVERWRELQGDRSEAIAEGHGSAVPQDGCFSPSPARDWDLDMCRMASRGASAAAPSSVGGFGTGGGDQSRVGLV